jgi:hypothetical protein
MIGAIISACVPFAALANDSIHLAVGSWHERIRTISATMDGKPIAPAPFDGSRDNCITAEQAANPSLYFTQNDGPDCNANGIVANGNISFSGSCRDEDFQTSFSMEGQYRASSYAMNAVATSLTDGKRIETRQVIDGHYKGPCPVTKAPTN